MKGNQANQRIEDITEDTLIVGVDIAKEDEWARFVDYRGREIGKAVNFKNDLQGFKRIVAIINEVCKTRKPEYPIEEVVIGMEPTGHYWKTLADYLMKRGYRVLCVNPAHTKKAKELDDNSQTKSDKKDALTIAKLITEGRYFDPYMPEGVFADLRRLSNDRINEVKKYSAVKNSIIAILDEYFPEIYKVFKYPLKGKTAIQIMKSCPFPSIILAMSEEEILAEIRKVVKRAVGIKKVRELIEAAKNSVGVEYGLESARIGLTILLKALEMHKENLEIIEHEMEEKLNEVGYIEIAQDIKGIGVVSLATFFGQIGDPLRFENYRQIFRYAGFNLVEDSSGKSKSGTVISKRGRKNLRSIVYQMAVAMVGQNAEMKELYHYLLKRKKNPLKKKQALVVIAKKVITIIYTLIKNNDTYKPELVLGTVRREMMMAA